MKLEKQYIKQNNNVFLSLNTGFAVNRFTSLDYFAEFISEFLKIDHLQLTSDFMMMNMDNKNILRHLKKLEKVLIKKNIKINSTFTGAYSRLNHLSHPDKEHQNFWIKWFKNFFYYSKKFGASYSGSHLGIAGIDEKKVLNSILRKRLLRNWNILSEYAYKIGLKGIIWEPMSIDREFGEKINKTKEINTLLNKNTRLPFYLCLDIAHGDETSNNKSDYNPYDLIDKLSKISPVIHLKQKVKNNHAHLPFTKKNNKSGIVKGKKIINILNKKKIKKRIELSLELSFKEREKVESKMFSDLKESIIYWKKVI